MRSLVYTAAAPQPLAWHDVTEPRLDSDLAAVVHPLAATTCDLDRAIIAGRTPLPAPFALGHECVAEVLEVGDGVRRVARGDVVVVPWHINCGACAPCRAGVTASCAAVSPRAMYGTPIGGDWGGLFSERVRVPYADAMLVPLPAGVAPEQVAAASDNLTDAWLAVSRPLATRPGAPVLILGGTGSIGLYAVEMARAAGSGEVTYVDHQPERLALAATLGARTLARPGPRSGEAAAPLPAHAIVVDTSGNPAELVRGLRAVGPGGACTSVGVYFFDHPLPLLDMYANDVTFRIGRPSVGPHIAGVLQLVARGQVHPEQVTSRVAPWLDAVEVLLERGASARKPILIAPRLT